MLDLCQPGFGQGEDHIVTHDRRQTGATSQNVFAIVREKENITGFCAVLFKDNLGVANRKMKQFDDHVIGDHLSRDRQEGPSIILCDMRRNGLRCREFGLQEHRACQVQ